MLDDLEPCGRIVSEPEKACEDNHEEDNYHLLCSMRFLCEKQ